MEDEYRIVNAVSEFFTATPKVRLALGHSRSTGA